jgi:hypothetical protein
MPSVKQYKVYEKCTDFFWINLVKYLLLIEIKERFILSHNLLDKFDEAFQNIKDVKKLLKSFYKLKLLQVSVELTANARESYHVSFTLKTEDEGHRQMRNKWTRISLQCKKLLSDLETNYSVYLDFNRSNKKRPVFYKKQSSPSRKGIQTSKPSKNTKQLLQSPNTLIDLEKLINFQSKKETGWLSLILSDNDSYLSISEIIKKVNSVGNQNYFRSLKLGGCIDFSILEPKVELNQVNDEFQDYAIIVVQSHQINFALKLYTDIDELISSLSLCDNLYLDFLDLTDDVIGDYQEILLKSKNDYKYVKDFNWYSLCIFIRTLLTYRANSFSEICSIDVKIIPLLGKLFCNKSIFLKRGDHSSLHGFLASLFVIFFKVNYVINKVSRNCSADVKLIKKTAFRDQIKSNSFSMKDESLANVGIFVKRARNKRIPLWYVPVLVVHDHRFVMFRTQNINVVKIIQMTQTGNMKIEVYASLGYDLTSEGCIFDKKNKRVEFIKSTSDIRSLSQDQFMIEIRSIINYHWIHHETQFTFNINGLDREYPLLHLRMDVPSQERLKPVHMNTILHSEDKKFQSLESFGIEYY